MAGCPLKCEWCANPETWSLKKQIIFTKSKCQSGCSRCVEACPQGSAGKKNGKCRLDWKKCRSCASFKCAEVCHTEALRVCGDWRTIEELMQRVERDKEFWDDEGGVTFSGGEPLTQQAFVKNVLNRCREQYINTAIETSAYAETKAFLNVMALVDFAFIDLKHTDPTRHKSRTGVDNSLILKNILALASNGWSGRVVLRVPIIVGFNDTKLNIKTTIDFMKSAKLKEINLLPFHRLGDSKWTQLGRRYKFKSVCTPDENHMESLREPFVRAGIKCYIGSETGF
jgi:pyruvate formate lyase activating enzyme